MRPLPRPSILLASAAVALGAGCGDSGPDPSPRLPATVVLDDYAFHPREVSVERGQALTVRNQGGTAHNLTIEPGPNPRRDTGEVAGTPSFLRGDGERLQMDLPPGRYVMVCTVPGHRELGMFGTLTVR